MENKTTTELIDLLHKDFPDEAYEDNGEYTLIIKELKSRSPFQEMLDNAYEESLPHLAEQVEYLQEQVKLLKRHKHDDKNGDVLVRL